MTSGEGQNPSLWEQDEWHGPGTFSAQGQYVIQGESSPTESNPRAAEELLQETIRHITGPRNTQYGLPTRNFQDTADLLNVIFQDKLSSYEWTPFTATDVSLVMIALKIARIMNDQSESSRDSWSDLAGYAACGYECVVSEDYNQ